jgi:hypothetical protein
MSLLDNSEFIKRIEKYDKIIDEENMKYKNYCHILKKILEHTPNTEMEKIMRRFIFLQHGMVKKKVTNR